MAGPEFDQYRGEISLAAGVIYRATRAGEQPDPQRSRVHMEMPDDFDDPESLLRAEIKEARINQSARSIARLATLADTIERGGIVGALAKVETVLTKLIERAQLRRVDEVDILVGQIRVANYDHSAIPSEV